MKVLRGPAPVLDGVERLEQWLVEGGDDVGHGYPDPEHEAVVEILVEIRIKRQLIIDKPGRRRETGFLEFG